MYEFGWYNLEMDAFLFSAHDASYPCLTIITEIKFFNNQ